MLFRAALLSILSCTLSAAHAQRPTATYVGGSVVMLELDGQRVLVDGPGSGGYLPRQNDLVLHTTGTADGPRIFSPALTGEQLELRTAAVGEGTGVYVYPRVTPAAGGPHVSYLLQWNGRRIWFCGDTGDPAALLATADLDLVFLTPDMADALARMKRSLDARMVVFYHTTEAQQQEGALTVSCARCKVLVPAPGEVLQLFR